MHKADFDGSLHRQNAAAQRLYIYAKWMGVGLGLFVAMLAMWGR
jgi:hypothetical protein